MPYKLTPQREAEIVNAIRKLEELDADIQKAERCGVECDSHREQARKLRDQLESFRREFSPKVY